MGGSDKEFAFKNFKIKHGFNSLPITTEAIVFGGFLANAITSENFALEIGTGCGILPLMITQKNKIFIHTVEINEKAFELAFENVQKSNYANQIGVFHTDIQFFKPYAGEKETEKYSFIFSNPPFFQNHLKGKNKLQNFAKHNENLTFGILALQIERFLEHNGMFIVLLPSYQLSLLSQELTKYGIYKNAEICIYHSQNTEILRIIATFGYKMKKMENFDFHIKDTNDQYSTQFKELLKDYYLNF